MKNHVNNLLKIMLLSFAIVAFGFNAQAQTCNTILKTKIGKVYSARNANIYITPSTDNIKVRVRKTGGKAETQMNIYVDGRLLRDKKVEWDAGRYTDEGRYTNRNLTGVNGKQVKIVIINQSVARTFDYKVKIEGASRSITTTGGKIRGTLMGQQNKTMYTNGSCTSKTRILIWREAYKAAANIRVYEKSGSGWRRLSQHDRLFAKNDPSEDFTVNSNKELKIELRNVSVGNRIKYAMDARPRN